MERPQERTGLGSEANYCLNTLEGVISEEYEEPCRRKQLDEQLSFIIGKLVAFIRSFGAVKSIVVNLKLSEADKGKLIRELKDCKKSTGTAYDYATNINGVYDPDINHYADIVNKLYKKQQSIASQMQRLIDSIRNTK